MTNNLNRRYLFFDAEFTAIRENNVEFLSIGMVSDSGEQFYVEIEQPAESIDAWVKDNVVPHLEGNAVSKEEAKERMLKFIKDNYGEEFKPLAIIDAYAFDWNGLCNMFGMWDLPFFYLPVDFGTLVSVNGYDIDSDRAFVARVNGIDVSEYKKHHAGNDAFIMSLIYNKFVELEEEAKRKK